MDFKKLIKEICNEENIDYKLISKDWVMMLSKNNITKCISGYRFPLNDHALGSIIDDKYAFYDLCKDLDLPIIDHQIFFNPKTLNGKKTFSLLEKYFKENKNNIVIKPNNGTEGNNVFHITKKEELLDKVKELFKNNYSISACPFYKINSEYRVVVLNKKVKLIFEKQKPIVIGNGKNTIKELLMILNPYYFKNIKLTNEYNRILKNEEVFEYDWRFNLSKGATANFVNDKKLYEKLSKIAVDVCNKINGNFLSIDIIKTENHFYLIEANSGVCINKVCNFIDKDLKLTKEIYKEAIISMFQK